MKSDGSYWLEMLNFVISSWLKVTILNTLNPLDPIYVTLLPFRNRVNFYTRHTGLSQWASVTNMGSF